MNEQDKGKEKEVKQATETDGGATVVVDVRGIVDAVREAQGDPKKPEDESKSAKGEDEKPETEQKADGKDEQKVEVRTVQDLAATVTEAVKEELKKVVEPPAGAAAGIPQIRTVQPSSERMEAVLGEVLYRALPLAGGQASNPAQLRQEIDNILKYNGLQTRALSIENNGVVIYEELARTFSVKPALSAIGRNHFSTVPLMGVRKETLPRFSRQGLNFHWGESTTSPLAESDPTLDTYDLKMARMTGAVRVADSLLNFNAAGPRFVNDYLLPEFRGAAQMAEDAAFFLSTGAAPWPTEWKGLRHMDNVTEVASSANGDVITLDRLDEMLSALPAAFRQDTDNLAFYMPAELADAVVKLLRDKPTPTGDFYTGAGPGAAQSPAVGPAPMARYRGVYIYNIPHAGMNETQGNSNNAGTAYLVYRPILTIGDGLAVRIEPWRDKGFMTLIQLEEWVGFAASWPEAVVRRPGFLVS